MKKLFLIIGSLLTANIAISKEATVDKKSELQKKLKSSGVLSTTKSHDSGKTGGGGNVGPRIEK